MKTRLLLLRFFACLGLLLTAGPAFLYLGGQISLEFVKQSMLIGMVLWFGAITLSYYLQRVTKKMP